MKITRFRLLFSKIFFPNRWSLVARLVYTTAAMLVIGAAITMLNTSSALHEKVEESINSRLQDFVHLIDKQQEEMLASLQTAAAGMATTDEVAMAIENENRLALQISVSRILDTIRQSTNRKPLDLQMYLSDAKPLYNTSNSNKLADKRRTSFVMVEDTRTQLKPFSGIQLLPSGPSFSATSPVKRGSSFVGIIEATATYSDLFDRIGQIPGFGMAVLLNKTQQDTKPQGHTHTPVPAPSQLTTSFTYGVTDIGGIDKKDLLKPGIFSSAGDLHFTVQNLVDYKNRSIGKLVYFYDGKNEIGSYISTIRYLGWLTVIGVLFISLILYFNVKRVRDFFGQLQKALMSSHSNDFKEPFITDNIHCLNILECGHKECPVQQNPMKVCYLEAGDLAISPKYRNTCIHLNTFKRCKSCPVYKLYRGDELMQVRNVVNTIMGLWGGFLESVGTVLSEMFKTDHTHMLSLDEVSEYLKQLAGLTIYSHDLQGVYAREEVYNQLQWVFESHFGLSNFNLLEVNSSENRMVTVIDRYNLNESHLDVFFNCDLCRAKRVAENLNSENNPQLCPYFGIDHANEVRCCMPMVMGGRVGAVFTFVTSRAMWKTLKENLGIMKKYLDETAPTLSSLRLLQISKEQSLRDPLTQCHNRRFMDEYLGKLEGLHQRNQRKIGFIMADLDHFKMVNDEFGHLAGDEILKQLATILRQNIRKSDLLVRYGGEEFLIILMEINQDNVTMQAAEKLRLAVENTKLVLPSGGSIKKTISMGVAEFPYDADQFYKVIKYADVALYKAKEQGRNRAIRFLPEMWEAEDY